MAAVGGKPSLERGALILQPPAFRKEACARQWRAWRRARGGACGTSARGSLPWEGPGRSVAKLLATAEAHALPVDLQILLDGTHPFGLEAREVWPHLHLRWTGRREVRGRAEKRAVCTRPRRGRLRPAGRACSALRLRLIASIWPASSSRAAARPELATSSELRWASHVFAPCFCSSSRFVSLEEAGGVAT